MIDLDGIEKLFPGDGLEIPDDDERDRADVLLAQWAARWNEPVVTVARVRMTPTLAIPTNRAFLRSRLRRWFAKE